MHLADLDNCCWMLIQGIHILKMVDSLLCFQDTHQAGLDKCCWLILDIHILMLVDSLKIHLPLDKGLKVLDLAFHMVTDQGMEKVVEYCSRVVNWHH